ncbi:hypothetical protein NLJ89_g7648 [Agrocybe chaxingu]|uniref:Uncharacterized protein n=1 Tax=Agrocybe chaxingu TaxID=84603 RepID=A0A9W8JVY7_9AGAR|nr:hypothetical protein NLJ89_g7648 [Agrocybe chaxingu]
MDLNGTYDGWTFMFLYSLFGGLNRYGFCRFNKSVMDELRQEIKALPAEESLSEEEGNAREATIHASYSTRVGTVYDLPGFLELLELEGREPPSSELVARMEEIFAGMEKGREFYQPFSKLTSEELPSLVQDSDTALE